MSRGLMLSHLQNTRYLHGGYVYREAIKKMLIANDADLVMEEIFVYTQHNRSWRLCRQVYDVVISSFSRYPAKVNHFRTNTFRKKIETALAEKVYSLFVISGADMLWSLDLLPAGVPILYISHNIEHLLYDQQVAKYAGVPWLGGLLRRDAEKFKAFELGHLQRLDKIIAIAAQDREALLSHCPTARIVTVTPSFDYQPRARCSSGEAGVLRLGFLGNLEWWPNRRSLKWFLDEVLPRVTALVEIHLYGQGSESFSDGNKIRGHGFVHDLDEVWQGIDLMIQPITCGAGVNIKVAEAIYNRVPMVATPMAVRGMELVEDAAITVLAEAREWIDFLNGPLPAQRARLAVLEENATLFSLKRNATVLQALLAGADQVQGN